MTFQFSIVKSTDTLLREIDSTPDSTVYSSPHWIAYHAKLRSKTLLVEVSAEGRILGWFMGHRRWMGIGIVSSPAMGMGCFAQGLCMKEFICKDTRIEIYKQLIAWFYKKHIAVYMQVNDWQLRTASTHWAEPWIDPLLSNYHVEYQPRWINTLDLTPTEEELWANLSPTSARYRVRKARRSGLIVRCVEEEGEIDSFIDRHYAHILEVCHRHGNLPQASQRKDRLLALCHSMPLRQLLLIEILHEGISVASGIFCLHPHVGCSFTLGSLEKYMPLCPNELMWWEAIVQLKRRGVPTLCLGAAAEYKSKYDASFDCLPTLIFTPSNSMFKGLSNLRKRGKRIYHKSLETIYKITHPSFTPGK